MSTIKRHNELLTFALRTHRQHMTQTLMVSVNCIDWVFVTSMFKIIVKIRFIASLVPVKFSNSHNVLAVDYTEQCWMGTVDSDDRGLILWLGKIVKLQAIHRLCNKLLMIMLNCWRVNESCTVVDITELLTQKLSAVCDKEFVGTWWWWMWQFKFYEFLNLTVLKFVKIREF